MRKINAWVTSDEVVHKHFDWAKRHAENRYGTLLCKLAHEIIKIEKYKDLTEWMEANGHRFVELEQLRLDVNLTREEDDY